VALTFLSDFAESLPEPLPLPLLFFWDFGVFSGFSFFEAFSVRIRASCAEVAAMKQIIMRTRSALEYILVSLFFLLFVIVVVVVSSSSAAAAAAATMIQ